MAKKLSQKETEKLIGGIREAYEAKIRQLNYRLDSLNVENRNLRASLAEYKNKENKVGKAIVDAEEKGEEIVRLYRMTAEAELKTLRLFSEKWKKLAEQMIGVFPKGEAEKYIGFADDLAALLGREEGHFLPKEEEKKEEEFDPKAIIGRYMEDEEETGFNLDDVLNPKGELDLAALCRGLGLMDDPAPEENRAEPGAQPTQGGKEPASENAAAPAPATSQPAKPVIVPSRQKYRKK